MRHLDTSIIVEHLRGDREISERIKENLPDLSMSAIVLAELEFGARASQRPTENLAKVRQFVEIAPVFEFNADCAAHYGVIRNQLRIDGRPIGETDTLIAASAMAQRATLVTRDRRHFRQIEGLHVEEW